MLFLFAFSLFTFSAHGLLLRDAGGTPLGVPVGLGVGRLLIHQLVEHLVVERGPGRAGFIPAPILQNISDTELSGSPKALIPGGFRSLSSPRL